MTGTPSKLEPWLTRVILLISVATLALQPFTAALHGLSHRHDHLHVTPGAHTAPHALPSMSSRCHHGHHHGPADTELAHNDVAEEGSASGAPTPPAQSPTDSHDDCPMCAKLASGFRSVLFLTEPSCLVGRQGVFASIGVPADRTPTAPALPRSARGPPLRV